MLQALMNLLGGSESSPTPAKADEPKFKLHYYERVGLGAHLEIAPAHIGEMAEYVRHFEGQSLIDLRLIAERFVETNDTYLEWQRLLASQEEMSAALDHATRELAAVDGLIVKEIEAALLEGSSSQQTPAETTRRQLQEQQRFLASRLASIEPLIDKTASKAKQELQAAIEPERKRWVSELLDEIDQRKRDLAEALSKPLLALLNTRRDFNVISNMDFAQRFVARALRSGKNEEFVLRSVDDPVEPPPQQAAVE